jgi:conjugal transfer pilin signal peptidase TrbI
MNLRDNGVVSSVWHSAKFRETVHGLKQLCFVFLLVFGWVAFIQTRYSIGIDAQIVQSIPGSRWVLIDHGDTSVNRGDLIAWKAAFVLPIPDGTQVMKYVVGIPGDIVNISPDGAIRINGEPVTAGGIPIVEGFNQAKLAGIDPATLPREYVIPDHRIFVVGTSAESFDSRYYGPIPDTFVSGTVHQLW